MGLMSLALCFTACATNPQNHEDMKPIKEQPKDAIEATIKAFAKAGDENDADEVSTHLDDNYRVVMNRLFGSSAVATVNKDVYLEKIRSKEWGGDQRKVTVQEITINGSNATAKVLFEGKKATVSSLMMLVQTENGTWKLVSDNPVFL